MNETVKENIRKFNKAKEELLKQGIEIIDYDLRTKKNRLVKNGEFIGYLDLENNIISIGARQRVKLNYEGRGFYDEWISFECEGLHYTRSLSGVISNALGCTGTFEFEGEAYVFTLELAGGTKTITPVVDLEDFFYAILFGNSRKCFVCHKPNPKPQIWGKDDGIYVCDACEHFEQTGE